jgi:hypothetical protein
LLDKVAVMRNGVLAWQCKVLSYTRFLKDLAFTMEVSNGSVDLIQSILIDVRLPDKVTEFQECSNGSYHLSRDVSSNGWNINLVHNIRSLYRTEEKDDDKPSSKPSSHHLSTV